MIQRGDLTLLGFPVHYIKTDWIVMVLIIFNPDLTNQGSERRRKMSVTSLLLPPLLLLALCSAAPYEVQTTTSAPAPSTPEKLVKAVKSVHCTVQYVTIWDTKYEDQPFEV